MMPRWFVYIGGFSLVLLGIMQIRARPYERGDSFYRRFINVGTLWSLCCMAVGGGLLAMALGYWDGPLDVMKPPPPPKSRYHHH